MILLCVWFLGWLLLYAAIMKYRRRVRPEETGQEWVLLALCFAWPLVLLALWNHSEGFFETMLRRWERNG